MSLGTERTGDDMCLFLVMLAIIKVLDLQARFTNLMMSKE